MKNCFLILLTVFSLSMSAQDLYLHCGKLVDTENGKILTQKTIVVSGTKIKSILNGYVDSTNPEDSSIDLKSTTVMPGLIDLHVHMESEYNPKKYMDQFTANEADIAFKSVNFARITLMAGFTTVRDLGGSGVNIALRNAINQGHIVGPRIFTAGKAIATTGGHADPTNGMKKLLMGDPGPQFTLEEIQAICATAKDYGMIIAAHAHGDEGMQRAVIGGVTTIEHGTKMSEQTMDLMIQYGTYLVPTITAGKAVAENAKIKGFYPEIIVPKALEIGPKIQNTFAKAYKRGVKIAFGTDAGVFLHGLNAKEFGYMVEVGMSPIEALQSATITNAKVLGLADELGQLKAGYIADIVATKDNPVEEISTLENVIFVMKEGVVFKNLN